MRASGLATMLVVVMAGCLGGGAKEAADATSSTPLDEAAQASSSASPPSDRQDPTAPPAAAAAAEDPPASPEVRALHFEGDLTYSAYACGLPGGVSCRGVKPFVVNGSYAPEDRDRVLYGDVTVSWATESPLTEELELVIRDEASLTPFVQVAGRSPLRLEFDAIALPSKTWVFSVTTVPLTPDPELRVRGRQSFDLDATVFLEPRASTS